MQMMSAADWDEAKGYDSSEEQLILAIRRHLLEPAQRDGLHARDLTIADLLNGRVGDVEHQAYAASLFRDWNAKLGQNEFMVEVYERAAPAPRR